MGAFADVVPLVPFHACETVSGQFVDVVNPDPNSIVLTDIAWSLSRQARFAGHTLSDTVWNVAQHSLFVHDLVHRALSWHDTFLNLSLVEWIARAPGLLSLYQARDYNTKSIEIGALLHDASEAYLVDLPSPVKRHQALREPYKALEKTVTEAIRIGLDAPVLTELEHQIIVWADLIALQVEAAHLMPSRGRGWAGELPNLTHEYMSLFPAHILGPKESYNKFVAQAASLGIRQHFLNTSSTSC